MRPVSGFERPGVQWLFAAVGVVLIAAALLEAAALQRSRREMTALRAAELNARLQHEELQVTAARERTARQALSLEVARLRGGAAGGSTLTTLTLSPLTSRGATPPEPTVETPAESQVVQLRLELPARAARTGNYAVVVRAWSGGEILWSRGGVRASSVDGHAMVTTFVTGDMLAPGAYEIALTRTSPDGKNVNEDVASYELACRKPLLH